MAPNTPEAPKTEEQKPTKEVPTKGMAVLSRLEGTRRRAGVVFNDKSPVYVVAALKAGAPPKDTGKRTGEDEQNGPVWHVDQACFDAIKGDPKLQKNPALID